MKINLNVCRKKLTGRGSFQLIQSRANSMSRAGAASAEYYFSMENSFGTWTHSPLNVIGKKNFTTMDARHWDSNPVVTRAVLRCRRGPFPLRQVRRPRTIQNPSSEANPLGQYTLLQWRRYWQPPVMKKTVHRDCHLQTPPISSLLSSTLYAPPRCYWSRATLSFSSPHLNVVIESIGAIVLDAYTTPRVTTHASTCTPYD